MTESPFPFPLPARVKPFCILARGEDGKLWCLIAPTDYTAACWGIALADLVRHVALDLEHRFGSPPNKTISELRALFEAEMDRPTDFPRRVEEPHA